MPKVALPCVYCVCHKQSGETYAICKDKLAAVQWISRAKDKKDPREYTVEKWYLTNIDHDAWGACPST